MSTETDSPLVSIAMPIYNEEKHLKEALESILNQDYPNLEILISDNHSTDGTAAICKEFAQKDARISYHQQDKNIGVGPNFVYVTRIAHGEFFMWASGHDKWSPNLISESVRLLESHKTATIAFGTPIWVTENGKSFKKYSGWYDTRGLNPIARFFMVFWGSMNPILGVFRRANILDISNYNFVGADLVVLCELALKGEFAHAEQAYFFRRQNRAVENHNQRMKRYTCGEMQIANSVLSRLLPLAKLPFELLRVVVQSQLGLLEKISLISLILPSMPIKYFSARKDSNLQK